MISCCFSSADMGLLWNSARYRKFSCLQSQRNVRRETKMKWFRYCCCEIKPSGANNWLIFDIQWPWCTGDNHSTAFPLVMMFVVPPYSSSCQSTSSSGSPPFSSSVSDGKIYPPIYIFKYLKIQTWSHWWFSGRILACHAGGPGSIPGQCNLFFFFFLTKEIDNNSFHSRLRNRRKHDCSSARYGPTSACVLFSPITLKNLTITGEL